MTACSGKLQGLEVQTCAEGQDCSQTYNMAACLGQRPLLHRGTTAHGRRPCAPQWTDLKHKLEAFRWMEPLPAQ